MRESMKEKNLERMREGEKGERDTERGNLFSLPKGGYVFLTQVSIHTHTYM